MEVLYSLLIIFLWLTPAAARRARMQIGGILLTERDGLIVTPKINT